MSTETPPGVEEFVEVGTGLTVLRSDEPVEGRLRWLDSPQEVLDFVAGDDVAESIVLVRGGTTTFLTPALTAGVKGVMTLQGAPESHLGILSREYGIPCLMGIQFERGVRSARGEVIPADGVRVRLDVSTHPRGRVLVEAGAPESDEPVAGAAMTPEQMEQIQLLLARYGGEVPHGSEGDAAFRATLATGVLDLTDESVHRALTREEVNDLSRYAGWNMWDCLAARATEGESGLIPRQEYESVSFIQCWERYPEFFRFMTDELGADGIIDVAAEARRSIGTKVNLLHAWAVGFAVAFGRGVSIGLGQTPADARADDLAEAFQFQRRLYKGIWGPPAGAMFTAMRGYRAPVLGAEWLERFQDEVTRFGDADERRAFLNFNASTEMLGFLLHYDNRAGLSDTGPYPTPDGGFVIVRDHFLGDPSVYHWHDVAEDLPYCVTQAMFFKPDGPLDLQLVDIGTLFTEPSDYLRHMTGMAIYARDTWDAPIRLVDAAERDRIVAACRPATDRLYRRIASMPKRDKVMAGVEVYYADFLLPFARQAGLWDRLVAEFDFFELDPNTTRAYYPLVGEGLAASLIPQLFLTGGGFPPLGE